LASRIRGALANRRLDDEFDRELQGHLAMLVDERGALCALRRRTEVRRWTLKRAPR